MILLAHMLTIRRSSAQKLFFDSRAHNKYDLAEIIGILLGDGGIHLDKHKKYQTHIAFNKLEIQYLNYVKELMENYFHPYRFYIIEIKCEHLLRNISVHLAAHLLKKGLKVGDKIKSKVIIPDWIFANETLLMRCIRGLFDTDGCVYRKYANYAQIQFKFASYPLIYSIRRALILLGFHPTKIESEINREFVHWKFYVIRQTSIERFFRTIKPKNEKHVRRYLKIKVGARRFERRSSGLEPPILSQVKLRSLV